MYSPDGWSRQRGDGSTPIVLLPGWATDARVFADLPLRGDTICRHGLISGPIDSLAAKLEEWQCPPIYLLGWSLGGFAAIAFARAHPQWVAEVVLVGVRRHYPHAQIDALTRALHEDKARALADFYRQCFLPAQRAEYRRFHATLQPEYQAEFPLEELVSGLEYLAGQELTPARWPGCPVKLIHGEHDLIAPLAEVCRLAEETGAPLHILPEVGHSAFLAPDFLAVVGHA